MNHLSFLLVAPQKRNEKYLAQNKRRKNCEQRKSMGKFVNFFLNFPLAQLEILFPIFSHLVGFSVMPYLAATMNNL
jgi:hypothetical protein